MLALEVMDMAIKRGATAAEVVVYESTEFSVSVRLGEIETLQEASTKQMGLRVIFEGRQASVATADFSDNSLTQLVEEAMTLAQATSVDEQLVLPSSDDFAREIPELRLADASFEALSTEEKIDVALRAEQAARDTDPRIVNFEGGGFEATFGKVTMVNSLGFQGSYSGTVFSLTTVPVARQDGQMQRDYWYSSARHFAELEKPESVGRKAAERALRRLGARKVKTVQVPVVFDPLSAADLLSSIFQAVSGDSIIRRSSFLIGKLDEIIASPLLTVIDDGTIVGALGSRPFDGEGLPTRRTVVIEDGVLRSYLLNTYTAHKLKLKSTANAARGVVGIPSVGPNNFFIKPGQHTAEEIISSVKNGFYVTDLIGFGVNIVTGDYSRGATGIWVEDGRLAYPVEEVTVAGNLKDMLKGIEMIGSDLEFRSRIAAPTLKINLMTVSGE
ncbi:MAG: TldD/PmbA family protein [Acidobacteriota bacterium]|nr:TldD/PmbA family protein [Blastocatellia bacterium]MDW8413639.1 TldD/PmbA family protein [Acidobacteriota bacterium]